jgi:hypothetical protein
MAQFTFEIEDDVLDSINEYLATQKRVEHDPETNMPRVIRMFADVDEFLTKTVAQVVAGVTQQFPTPAMRNHLIAKRQAELAIEAAIKPRLTKVVQSQ